LDGIALGDENASKKKRKTGAVGSDDVVWKKKSKKKNVMDNILGIIFDIKWKTKDNLAARLNL
jgi:hypothetical protein